MVPRTTIWELDLHTQAKHELLRRYLGGWFGVFGSTPHHDRVLFLDGFAGPGRYANGEEGSPIIALETLLYHDYFYKFDTTFVFWFLEQNVDRFDSLEIEVADLEHLVGGFPDNVVVELACGTFADVASQMTADLREQGSRLAPTFAFLDPFGFSHTPMEVVADLLAFPGCEVFINFMFDSVNRFITVDSVDNHVEELFGCRDFENVAGLSGQARREFIHDLYARQLREAAGFDYVTSFAMVPERGHTVYYLFHGTRHIKGLELMKEAMWKIDPIEGNRFQSSLADQPVLLGLDIVDTWPLQLALRSHFGGRDVGIGLIVNFTLTQTPYAGTHVKKLTLKPMEQADELEVVSSPRKRALTYPPGTIVRFRPLDGDA